MKSKSPLGHVTGPVNRRRVRFERVFDSPVEDVWAALTEPEQIAQWFAKATLEPRVGGRIELEGPGGAWRMTGMVRVFDPPRALEYDWVDTHQTSVVRFELASEGERTRLTLVEFVLTDASAERRGAGWHQHLDRLAASLAGEASAGDEERWRELRTAYAALLEKG